MTSGTTVTGVLKELWKRIQDYDSRFRDKRTPYYQPTISGQLACLEQIMNVFLPNLYEQKIAPGDMLQTLIETKSLDNSSQTIIDELNKQVQILFEVERQIRCVSMPGTNLSGGTLEHLGPQLDWSCHIGLKAAKDKSFTAFENF